MAVFISHVSGGHGLADQVHRWLVVDGHEAFLDRDLRDGLVVGEEWEQRLHERLRWAERDKPTWVWPGAAGRALRRLDAAGGAGWADERSP